MPLYVIEDGIKDEVVSPQYCFRTDILYDDTERQKEIMQRARKREGKREKRARYVGEGVAV
jgi:hypothetical protein